MLRPHARASAAANRDGRKPEPKNKGARPTGTAPLRLVACPPLLQRPGVRVDQPAGLPLLRIEDDPLAGPHELAELRGPHVLELDHEHSALRPPALGGKLHLADDGAELGGAEVFAA